MKKKHIGVSAMSLMLSVLFAQIAQAEDLTVVEPTGNPAEVSSPTAVSPAQPDVEKVEAVQGGETRKVLGDVVVSASRIAQSSLEAPTNVSLFTAKKLEERNNQRIGDALNASVPSLYLRGGALRGSKGGANALTSMRGQGGTLTKIGLMVDGMNMIDAYSGQVFWNMVSMDDVERIEVAAGVGSSLYGGNAMGGVINITTKAPTKREMTVKLSKGFNDQSGKGASAIYRDKFENGLGAVFGLSKSDRDGYVAEFVTKSPSGTPSGSAVVVNGAIPTTTVSGSRTYIVGDKGLNASTERNIHAKLYFDLSPTSKMFAGFAYMDDKSLSAPYHSYLKNAATGSSVPIDYAATSLNLNGLATSTKQSDYYGSLPMGHFARRYFAGYDGEVNGSAKLSLSVGRIDRDQWSSSATDPSATWSSGSGTFVTSPNSTTNASAQLSLPLSDMQFIVAGVATEIGILSKKNYALSNWTDLYSKTAVRDTTDARSITNSIYVQDQIAWTDKFTTYVGGRYDAWKAGARGTVIVGNPTGTFAYSDRTASAFSPKISGVYMFRERLTIKSSIGTGFRAPTNYYLFANPTFSGGAGNNTKITKSNPDLKPEKNRSFDLGMEYDLMQGGNVKATYYITRTTDLIYQKVTPLDVPEQVSVNQIAYNLALQMNTGTALARGIELSAEYPVISWLTVSGSYTYTDSRITSDLTNTGMLGKRVTNVPKNMATFGLDAKRGDLSGSLSARYVGRVFSNNDNSDVAEGVWTGYSIYTVADLKVGYRVSREFKVNLMVDNLFDRKYYEYYAQPGRSASVELVGNF